MAYGIPNREYVPLRYSFDAVRYRRFIHINKSRVVKAVRYRGQDVLGLVDRENGLLHDGWPIKPGNWILFDDNNHVSLCSDEAFRQLFRPWHTKKGGRP